ncbi:hypothetical protein QEZ47_02420 [Aminobacter anthyllidis]|uniref:glucosyltransferase domain-containing protein n=1 Tax=Aminobacter anthyllidis TaxID=1035067 RepID=UPI002453853A|nr:glucosyltransferase domain-containing protein [Aminobacter anthyllidis]MDH4984433.1 hypothetical protein [Aminobacter anthyllidis]
MIEKYTPCAYLALLILLAHATSAAPTFLTSDDWLVLNSIYNGERWGLAVSLVYGRVVYGVILQTTFAVFDSIAAAIYTRLFGIVGLAVAAVLMFKLLLSVGVRREHAFFLALTSALLPPSVEVGVWATTAGYSWASAIALAAAMVLAATMTRFDGKWARHLAGPIAITVIALFTYPPAAQLLFFLPLIYMLMDNNGRPKPFFGASLASIATFAIAGVVFVLIWKTYQAVFSVPGLPAGRGIISSPAEIPGKINFFVNSALISAGNLFGFGRSAWLAATVLAISAGQFLFGSGGWKQRFLRLTVWLAILGLSYAANLATKENWPSFRSQTALRVIVWVSFSFGIARFVSLILARMRSVRSMGLIEALSPIVIISLILRQMLYIGPTITYFHQQELAALRSEIDRLHGRNDIARVIFVLPHWSANRSPIIGSESIGVPSTTSPAVAFAMMNVIHRDRYLEPFAIPVVTVKSSEAQGLELLPRDYVLDFHKILTDLSQNRAKPFP